MSYYSNLKIKLIKAAPRFELEIEDLQSTALPLGYTAIFFNSTLSTIIYFMKIRKEKMNKNLPFLIIIIFLVPDLLLKLLVLVFF